jgi:hypothetical protein
MRTVLLGVGLLALAAGAGAAESYAIKVKPYPDVGKSITVRLTSRQTIRLVTRDSDGEVDRDRKQKEDIEQEFTYKVLKKGKKRPLVYAKTYATARRNGRRQSFQGRTVVFTLRDGKYRVKAEGKPALARADLAELTRGANDSEGSQTAALLPGKRVKVGGTWKIRAKATQALLGKGLEFDSSQCKGTGKLLKAYQKDGKTWGVMQVRVTLVITRDAEVAYRPPAKVQCVGTLEGPIDGSSTALTVTMKMKLKGKAVKGKGGEKLTLEITSEANGKEEYGAEK